MQPVIEDPLDALSVRPDGSITQVLGDDNQWHRVPGFRVPKLKGIKGIWNGYTPEDDWESSFGWPNDREVFRYTRLFSGPEEVGVLWFYRFPSQPGLIVAFLYTSMESSTDEKGEHEGHHKFVWWGEIKE